MTTPAPGQGIEVTGRHSALQWILYFIQLTVEVDGRPEAGPWGRPRFIALPAGDHTVSVYFKYLWKPRCCEAVAVVQVAPGQVTRVTYDAPLFMTSRGSLFVG
jgi:hypothetical protein